MWNKNDQNLPSPQHLEPSLKSRSVQFKYLFHLLIYLIWYIYTFLRHNIIVIVLCLFKKTFKEISAYLSIIYSTYLLYLFMYLID